MRISASDFKAGARVLKRNPHAELNLAAWRRGFSDRAKLGRIYEAVGRAKIRVIERVEGLRANLELERLGHGELALQCAIKKAR